MNECEGCQCGKPQLRHVQLELALLVTAHVPSLGFILFTNSVQDCLYVNGYDCCVTYHKGNNTLTILADGRGHRIVVTHRPALR